MWTLHWFLLFNFSGLAKLLSPCLSTLRDTLSAIPTVSVAVVNLEFSGRNILPAQFEHVCTVYV